MTGFLKQAISFLVFRKEVFKIENELYHHGVKGQKWGVRRYQNSDGSLTDNGKKRVAKLNAKIDKADKKAIEAFNSSKKHFQDKKIFSKENGLDEYQKAIFSKNYSDRYRKKLRAMGINRNESLKVRAAEYEAGKAFAEKYGNKKIKDALRNKRAIEAGMIVAQAHQQMTINQMNQQMIINQIHTPMMF